MRKSKRAGARIEIANQRMICDFNRGISLVELHHAFRPRKILQSLHERRRGNDDAKIGQPAGRFDGGAAAREIETDRNFSGERKTARLAMTAPLPAGKTIPIRSSGNSLRRISTQRRRGAEQFGATQLAVIQSIDDPGRKEFAFQSAHAGFGQMSI